MDFKKLVCIGTIGIASLVSEGCVSPSQGAKQDYSELRRIEKEPGYRTLPKPCPPYIMRDYCKPRK
jgi:hypothetical protein